MVANDDGGSIFASSSRATRARRRYDRLFGTPHGVDLASPVRGDPDAALAGRSGAELEQALASPNGGIEVVEAVVRRDNRRALDEAVRALAHTGQHAEGPH